MQLKLHTILLTVGPSGSGKTFFIENYLIPQLRSQLKAAYPAWYREPNIQHISSDVLRRTVLGHDYHKHNPIMMQASNAAFSLLNHITKAVTSYPQNAEFVIVDTTGLSSDFRKEIIQIARENNYRIEALVFDYKKMSEYEKHLDSSHNLKIVYKHVKKMREDTLGKMGKREFDAVHRIPSKNFESLPVEVKKDSLDFYVSCLLPPDCEYEVVGDVQGCLQSLKSLLVKMGFSLNGDVLSCDRNKRVVLAGDWIDKGPQSKETLQFIKKNLNFFYLVKGNHENFVYKWFEGKVDDVPEDIRVKYFTTTEEFANDSETLALFRELHDLSREFFIHDSFIVTHAPCEVKYLGKLSGVSLKNQRNIRYSRPEGQDRQSEIEGVLGFLPAEAAYNLPYHIFGHVPSALPIRVKNKIGVDTGCVSGNRLTSVCIKYKPFFTSVETVEAVEKELLPVLFRGESSVDLSELEDEEVRKLKRVCHNKINFISGTMSPADKCENYLESPAHVIDYYRKAGVSSVVVQPKWMGSRCQIYIHEKLEDCYAVTRNGYRIKWLDLSPVFSKFLNSEHKLIVYDGELLPWFALGEGLIKNTFEIVGKGIETELECLRGTGFHVHLAELRKKLAESDFTKDCNTLSKANLKEKYGHIGDSFRTLLECPPLPTAEESEAYFKIYQRQLEVFGQPGELGYKPFSILKIVDKEGKERVIGEDPWLSDNYEVFKYLNTEALLLDLDNPEAQQLLEHVFYRAVTDEMEGLVIKPRFVNESKQVAPYLKLRSEKYLSIIYGYDYKMPHKYNKLKKTKSISKKLRLSISEWNTGLEMLKIPYDSISYDNKDFVKLAASAVLTERAEKTLDPRL